MSINGIGRLRPTRRLVEVDPFDPVFLAIERMQLNRELGLRTSTSLPPEDLEELNRWDRQNLVNKYFDDRKND